MCLSMGCIHLLYVTGGEQMLVWKEVNYGAMSEKEKQLIVSEVRR